VPQGWIDDRARCRAAGVPEQVGFATKPALATRMICRALDAGAPAAWITSDEVDGANPGLRAELEARGVGYVLAVACDHRVRSGGATLRRRPAQAGPGAGERLSRAAWKFEVAVLHPLPAVR
jgi:SRSO17 transposase